MNLKNHPHRLWVETGLMGSARFWRQPGWTYSTAWTYIYSTFSKDIPWMAEQACARLSALLVDNASPGHGYAKLVTHM